MICFTSGEFRKEKSLQAGIRPYEAIIVTTPMILFFAGILISSVWIEPENDSEEDQLQSLKELDKFQKTNSTELRDNISLPKSLHQSLQFESKLSEAGLNRAELPQTRYSLFHPHAFALSHY